MPRPVIYTDRNVKDGTTLKLHTQLSNITSPEYIIEGVEQSKQTMFVSTQPFRLLLSVEFCITSKHSVRDTSPLYTDWISYDPASNKLVLLTPLNDNFIYSFKIRERPEFQILEPVIIKEDDDIIDKLITSILAYKNQRGGTIQYTMEDWSSVLSMPINVSDKIARNAMFGCGLTKVAMGYTKND